MTTLEMISSKKEQLKLSSGCTYADVVELGSDGSAARGGRSDRSEWQRSIKSRISVSPKILSGTATGRLIGFLFDRPNEVSPVIYMRMWWNW